MINFLHVAMDLGHLRLLLLVFLFWVCFFVPSTHELQASQTQVLMQLRKHLEYPLPLESWVDYYGDMCFIPSSAHMSIKCDVNSVTELKIMGNKFGKVSSFNGFAVPNHTLSQSFSIDSFVTTLSRLTSLRVLILVSLGIWGPLPDKIHRLSSLELLDLSSNFIFGSIPPKMAKMVMLQTLTLDDNYFNETMPDWFGSLSNLTILSFKSNQLKGHFPNSLCHITTLTDIAMPHNELSGRLPDLSSLTSLHVLDLRENRLDSELPAMPKGLITALLSKNSLSGRVSNQFDGLRQLQHLDLSFNHVSGMPPSGLFSLPNISYLNLASNKLKGSFPKNLNCGRKLGFVDISSNKLLGEIPFCLGSDSDKTMVKLGGNCFSGYYQDQKRELYCKEDNARGNQFRGGKVVISVAVMIGAVLVLVLIALGITLLCRRYRTFEPNTLPKAAQASAPTGVSPELLANARFIQAAKLGTQGAPACRLFSLEELREVTNNFSSSAFMGEGSGGKIYKGKLENGNYIAIRSLTLLKKHSVQNLKGQLDYLSKLHHPHLVGFLGHCIHCSGKDDSCASKVFLVYEYVPNGNYRTHLSEYSLEKGLKWADRLSILIGVAKAVRFLHTGVIPGSFNNRLRTNNILLDEHRIAKLSDYAMSTIITEEVEKHEAKGEGPKSRAMAKLHDDDVYNFGFVLLESLVGPNVTGKEEAFLLNEMASFDVVSVNANQENDISMSEPAYVSSEATHIASAVASTSQSGSNIQPIAPLEFLGQTETVLEDIQKSSSEGHLATPGFEVSIVKSNNQSGIEAGKKEKDDDILVAKNNDIGQGGSEPSSAMEDVSTVPLEKTDVASIQGVPAPDGVPTGTAAASGTSSSQVVVSPDVLNPPVDDTGCNIQELNSGSGPESAKLEEDKDTPPSDQHTVEAGQTSGDMEAVSAVDAEEEQTCDTGNNNAAGILGSEAAAGLQ